jgi:hypothetical protein
MMIRRGSDAIVLAATMAGFAFLMGSSPAQIVPFQATQCQAGRKYCHVTKSGEATGASSTITTRATTLCGEPSEQTVAHSAAFSGVKIGDTPTKWAQVGYIRRRIQGTTVNFQRYAETLAGSDLQTDYDYYFENGVPSGTHKYRCYLISALFGTWKYEIDDEPFHQFSHNGWRGVTGTHYQWAAEIRNLKDQMVGTESDKCQFAELQYALNYGAFQDRSLSQGDLYTDDSNEWGIELCGCSYSFFVWDKNP